MDGSIHQKNKKWVVRISFVGKDGKRKFRKKTFETQKEARAGLKAMLLKLETKGAESIDIEKILFRDLAERYANLKIKEPVFRGDKQISGMRSYRMVKVYLRYLLAYFGGRKLEQITPGLIQEFKQERLNQKSRRGTEFSIARIHRELELLRAILNFAKAEGLIDRTAFERSTKPLIEKSDEEKRSRVLSLEEETALLAVLNDPVRSHIKPLVVAGIDTGMRRAELTSLLWSDVYLDSELLSLRKAYPDRESVFGIAAFHHAWRTALKLGEDFRFSFP